MFRNPYFKGSVVLLLLTAVVCAQVIDRQPYPVENFSEDIAYKVVKIVDGDTVDIDYKGEITRVRLKGVDTPETVHPNKPVELGGREASIFMHNLLIGESVYLRFDEDREDNFERMLAYLYRAPDGLFVNLEIVRQGYGRVEVRFPLKHKELFLHYEQIAKETRKGVWGDPLNFMPIQPDPVPELNARVFTGTFPNIESVIDGDTINDVSVKIFEKPVNFADDWEHQELWPGVQLRDDGIYAYNKIRIKGIDTPEMNPKRGDRAPESINLEKKRAVDAKKFLRALITKSNQQKIRNLTVKITNPGPGSFYGRIVADVLVNKDGKEVSVAEELVREGHAVEYKRNNPHDWGAK